MPAGCGSYDSIVTAKSIVIPRKPQACWLAFTNVDTLCAWVPGLRVARMIARAPNGMPSEIEFEFFQRSYTLAYAYEGTDTAKIVRWHPKSHARDAVYGWARFEPCDEGTLLVYELVHGVDRTELERYLDNTDELVGAFARWMTEGREPSARDIPHEP